MRWRKRGAVCGYLGLQQPDPHLVFGYSSDSIVDDNDRATLVHEFANTYFGDANLDGEFNSTDFVSVFRTAEYEDGIVGNSTWAEGDWNGNGDFETSDLVLAFQDGGCDRGPRISSLHVPEPQRLFYLPVCIGMWFIRRRRRSESR